MENYIKFYNSLSKSVEKFEPIEDKKVIIYVCGLTPYDNVHLGHARTYSSFDIIKRYLTSGGYSVFHIQNITDVEDKIINRALESKRNPLEIAIEFQSKADVVFKLLNILPANVYPKASEHIKEIISMIEEIVKKGYGYVREDGVYFEVSKFKSYGQLSGQKLESLIDGARIEINKNKKHPEDFALWKIEDNEVIGFDSPFGRGRPGWHIECSAMSMKYSNGRTLDIHGGGRDLIFPHHENEIAQTESALGIKFSKYWIHTGFLTVNGEKMSKSLGNFVTIEEVLKNHKPNTIRLFFALTHYRSPINYNEEEMYAVEKTVNRIFETYKKLNDELDNTNGTSNVGKFKEDINEFYEYMNNDFNTPQALASFFNLIKKINSSIDNEGISKVALDYLKNEFDKIIYIIGIRFDKSELESKKINEKQLNELKDIAYEFGIEELEDSGKIISKLIKKREEFRNNKLFDKSDKVREELKKIGITLEDKKGGTGYKIL